LPKNITDPTDPTSYASYPAVVKLDVDLTGGNLPCTGSGQITFTGGTGANSMTGTYTLTKDDVVFNINLALDDQFNVSGSITVVESGATLLLTDVQGAVLGTLTCNVTVDPYGWTGIGTINLLTGAMTTSINMETGMPAATATSDTAYSLSIIYPDTTGEIVANALTAALTDIDAITATGGTPQNAVIDTAFDSPLVATVKDSEGNPVSDATVTFAVPGSGASGSFAGGVTTATTDTSGVATSAVFTANGTAGSYKVTATVEDVDISGGPAVFDLTNLTLNQAGGGYAYVANADDGTVSQYKIGSNGALKPMSPATVAPGGRPNFMAADPSGKYVYVTSWGTGVVSQYTVGTNGALTPMSPATVATAALPFSIAVDPSGKYAYVANYIGNYENGTVSQYTIGTDGTLTPMNPATVATGVFTAFVIVDPSGKYVYVTNAGDGTVSQFTIGPSGALTPMSPATVAATAAYAIAVAPSGKYAYVTSDTGLGNGVVSQFTIGSDGALTAMNPATVPAGDYPYSIAVDPSGKYVYTANYEGDTVSQYTIGRSGALTPMNQPTVLSDSSYAVAVAPSGMYVYVANYDAFDTVSQFMIDSKGALTPMSPATVAAGSYPDFVLTIGRQQ
jgi:6-phosphogluconolactonase (cycloisomerase 2 family)